MRACISLLAVILIAGGSAGAQSPSPPPPPVQRIERFNGTVKVAGRDVRVAIDTWLIPNAQKIAALDLSLRGQTMFELRGGSIVTIIAGRREKRAAGELWAVAASVKVAIETENDSAALQTTVVAD